MSLRNTPAKWGSVARFLHWGVAAVILAAIAVGLVMGEIPKDSPLFPMKFAFFTLHKSLGLLALGLVLCRIVWRLADPAPRPPASVPRWQVRAAEVIHWSLYGLMIAVPVAGYLMSSYAGRPFPLFMQPEWQVPLLTRINPDLQHLFGEVHEALAWGLILILGLHVAAALFHHVIRKDDILARMTPFIRPPRPPHAGSR